MKESDKEYEVRLSIVKQRVAAAAPAEEVGFIDMAHVASCGCTYQIVSWPRCPAGRALRDAIDRLYARWHDDIDRASEPQQWERVHSAWMGAINDYRDHVMAGLPTPPATEIT